MRLIDADALESKLRTLIKRITPIEDSRDMFYHDSGMNGAITGAILEVKKAPTAAPARLRPKGEWIDNIDKDGFLCNAWRKCSVCGGLNFSKRPPFCPNCGADMRPKEAENE